MNFTRLSRIISKKNRFLLYEPKNWIDGLLKYLNRFFVKHLEGVKMLSIIIKKNLRFLSEIDQNVPIFVEKLQKIQPLKMTFRSQLEPSIKSYECFMFLLNFRLEMTLD